jgi:hypothetical protein
VPGYPVQSAAQGRHGGGAGLGQLARGPLTDGVRVIGPHPGGREPVNGGLVARVAEGQPAVVDVTVQLLAGGAARGAHGATDVMLNFRGALGFSVRMTG